MSESMSEDKPNTVLDEFLSKISPSDVRIPQPEGRQVAAACRADKLDHEQSLLLNAFLLREVHDLRALIVKRNDELLNPGAIDEPPNADAAARPDALHP